MDLKQILKHEEWEVYSRDRVGDLERRVEGVLFGDKGEDTPLSNG